MADTWEGHCKAHLGQHKCLNNLCITGKEGNIYGTSSPDFQVPPELILKLRSVLANGSDTSFDFLNDKYIIIRHDDSCLISKSGKKSILFYCTDTMCLVGQTVDDETNKCNAGNIAMANISDFYKKKGL
ncbi:unnamed protein product [Trichobilharzia szidati]|nr:unnamed protein product [Trichobilharzia szidati]CAH8868877.1 unnamed protein product [Trichobilharzia szidati]